MNNFGEKVSFIWSVADLLRGPYRPNQYKDVMLPMTVLRRLDCVLEPTKDAVLAMKTQLDKAGVANQHAALCQASGEAFYNTSPFRLRDLTSRARRQQLKADFEAVAEKFALDWRLGNRKVLRIGCRQLAR